MSQIDIDQSRNSNTTRRARRDFSIVRSEVSIFSTSRVDNSKLNNLFVLNQRRSILKHEINDFDEDDHNERATTFEQRDSLTTSSRIKEVKRSRHQNLTRRVTINASAKNELRRITLVYTHSEINISKKLIAVE